MSLATAVRRLTDLRTRYATQGEPNALERPILRAERRVMETIRAGRPADAWYAEHVEGTLWVVAPDTLEYQGLTSRLAAVVAN